ncbi:hypothetical protein [Palleronia abyssalis]|uniref:Uncharacterized protein n=1 Tax=Palleronia abyssalis TaxID=1501240 RepID=A0A2R8C1B4_9RHOB|nr:hypothetical protein [Palleronia abyssalis]SPJ26204.1 hypothetical protein PAA8504_04060 [Palleronia abyssalis]
MKRRLRTAVALPASTPLPLACQKADEDPRMFLSHALKGMQTARNGNASTVDRPAFRVAFDPSMSFDELRDFARAVIAGKPACRRRTRTIGRTRPRREPPQI